MAAMSRVTFIETTNRAEGVRATLKAMGSGAVKNKDVVVKPNFNTADPTPGSTHNDTLIALIDNLAPFSPDIVLLDGVEAFVDGGPATGKRAAGNVFLASGDRVAVDAVGVAVLKHLGSNADIMGRKIFDQRQIRRAAELKIGAASPADIELVAVDEKSIAYRDKIRRILSAG